LILGPFGRLTDFQSRDELTESDDEKVKVEKELELLVEYQGQKADYRVLLISNDIWRIR